MFGNNKKSEVYYLINRLLCLIMTLPVSTATTTTERSFFCNENNQEQVEK